MLYLSLNLPCAIFANECCFSYKRSGSALKSGLLYFVDKKFLTQLPCNVCMMLL